MNTYTNMHIYKQLLNKVINILILKNVVLVICYHFPDKYVTKDICIHIYIYIYNNGFLFIYVYKV